MDFNEKGLKRTKVFALLFVCIFCFSFVGFTITQMNGPMQSQTRTIHPEAEHAPSIQTSLATSVTYVYGTQTAGTYTATQINDTVYHVSVSASYISSTPTVVKLTIGEPTFTYGYVLAQNYTKTFVQDDFAETLMETSSIIDCYYTFRFTEASKTLVTGLTWNIRAKGDTTCHIYIYNFDTSAWDDTGQDLYTTWETHSASIATKYMNSSGYMRLRLYEAGFGVLELIDYAHWDVTYNAISHRISLYYPFQFSGGAWNTISGLTWSAKGKTNTSTVDFLLYNWQSVAWDDTSVNLNTTDKSYGATISKAYYVQSSNCSMRMKFYRSGSTVPLNVSVDYLCFTVTYTPAGQQTYSSIVPTANPTAIFGTLGGSYWHTWTVNSSYQTITGPVSLTKVTSAGPTLTYGTLSGGWWQTISQNSSYQDITSTSYNYDSNPQKYPGHVWQSGGTVAWNNPNNIKVADTNYASVALSTGWYTHYIRPTTFGFTLPSDATITGIMVSLHRYASSTYAHNGVVVLTKDNSTSSTPGQFIGDHYSTSLEWKDYGNSIYLWGTTWTYSEINSANFGVVHIVYAEGGAVTPYLDCIAVTTYYTQTKYRVDAYWSFQFTTANRGNVTKLGWGFYGHDGIGRTRIHLYNWATPAWDNYTGGLIPASNGALGQASVTITSYMATNGSMRLRLFKDLETATFTPSVDYLYWTVTYGGADCYYSLQFTAASQSTVSQLGWLVNGKTNTSIAKIYLWNWGTKAWDNTTKTLTSTAADVGQSVVSYSSYMATNGSVRIRFFVAPSQITVSLDFIRIDVVYATPQDTTPPGTPNLFYPTDGQALTNKTLVCWNDTLDDAEGSGLAYYYLQVSLSPAFGSGTYNITVTKTWYEFSSALTSDTWYWHVKAVDNAGNEGSYSTTRYFYQTVDPQAIIIYQVPNNPSLNDYLNPASFNTTYHRSIQDGAGVWNTLSPYMPVINMYSVEYVNITVRDWLGNYIISNQRYSYSPTIIVNLNVFDVCVGNGADAMAYIILRSGTTILHKFTYSSDIHWLVIAGVYNLTVIYPSVGNIQVYYNLTITGDYGIKVSSNATADLYSASTNWDLLTSNVASIVTTVQGVKTDVYNMGWTQAQMQTVIQGVASQISDIGADIEKPGGIISDQYAALKLLVSAIGSPIALAIITAIVRVAAKQRNEAEALYKKHIRDQNEGKGTNYPNREHVTTPQFVRARRNK